MNTKIVKRKQLDFQLWVPTRSSVVTGVDPRLLEKLHKAIANTYDSFSLESAVSFLLYGEY